MNFINIFTIVDFKKEFYQQNNNMDENKINILFNTLKTIFLQRNMLYAFNMKNKQYRIVERIYLDNGSFLSINEFYLRLRSILNTQILSIIVVEEFFKQQPKNNDTVSEEDNSIYS